MTLAVEARVHGRGSHVAHCPQPELRPLTQRQPSLSPAFLGDLLHRDENPGQKVVPEKEEAGDEPQLFEKSLQHQRFLKTPAPGRVGNPLPAPCSHSGGLGRCSQPSLQVLRATPGDLGLCSCPQLCMGQP